MERIVCCTALPKWKRQVKYEWLNRALGSEYRWGDLLKRQARYFTHPMLNSLAFANGEVGPSIDGHLPGHEGLTERSLSSTKIYRGLEVTLPLPRWL